MSGALQERFSRIAAFKPVVRREPVVAKAADCRDDLLARIGGEIGRNHYGEYVVSRQWYATPQMCEPSTEVLRLLLPLKRDRIAGMLQHAIDPEKWLFVDTETTGLAGGTGTYAFLVGLAWWESGGLRIEQLFMRDYDEEHSLLLELADRLDKRPVLVTFNGKSFDWPLLQNRFRMTRQIDVPELVAHLDFLHPARQLWRLQIGSTRLTDLERSVLGADELAWSRLHDVDSACIPDAYFEFLRTGATERICGVFQHNRMDLRGLAALAGRILQLLDKPENVQTDPLEYYGISQLLARRGQCSQARRMYEHCLNAELPEPIARKARHEAAKLAKRERDFGRATQLWNELASSIEPSFEALEQLAIHYERREQDYREAARITRSALGELRRASRLGLIRPERHEHLSARLRRRLIRVQSKADRNKSLGRLL
jgi:uncharacterized protein YprB with RNaseH-like and TPR domain